MLNSHDDIEKLKICDHSRDLDSHGKPKKLNSEIQLYLSLPYVKNFAQIKANLMKSNMVLMDIHLNEEFQNPDKNPDFSGINLFDYLKLYCAQHKTSNCDLNVINLNNYRSYLTQNNLLNNKYFRRALGVMILNDLLGVIRNENFSNHSYNTFLRSYNTFVVGFNLKKNKIF